MKCVSERSLQYTLTLGDGDPSTLQAIRQSLSVSAATTIYMPLPCRHVTDRVSKWENLTTAQREIFIEMEGVLPSRCWCGCRRRRQQSYIVLTSLLSLFVVTGAFSPPPYGRCGLTTARCVPEEENLEWNDLEWRVQRSRLTHYNTLKILRRKPRYLSYDEASKWVQKMGQWTTESDWQAWLASGEKRNPYLPNDPKKYYGDEWQGWAHFLTGESSSSSSDA